MGVRYHTWLTRGFAKSNHGQVTDRQFVLLCGNASRLGIPCFGYTTNHRSNQRIELAMAPIRRYLRISKYTVIECRIYLETPSDVRWLLGPRGGGGGGRQPALSRIMTHIKPQVLPKVREASIQARTARRTKKKSAPVKDTVVREDYEVALFLRETGAAHSLMKRHKMFGSSNRERPIEISDEGEQEVALADIPQEGDRDDSSSSQQKRTKNPEPVLSSAPGEEKKLAMTTRYEGFALGGWILCLLVTRRRRPEVAGTSLSGSRPRVPDTYSSDLDTGKSETGATLASGTPARPGGAGLLEEWIATQAAADMDVDAEAEADYADGEGGEG